MEASLPLTSLEGKKNLSTTVEVAVPLRVFRILEVGPHIVVNLLEPLQALLVTCELICLDEADCRLKVTPRTGDKGRTVTHCIPEETPLGRSMMVG